MADHSRTSGGQFAAEVDGSGEEAKTEGENTNMA